MIQETELQVKSGLARLPIVLVVLLLAGMGVVTGSELYGSIPSAVAMPIIIISAIVSMAQLIRLHCFFTVSPDEARVITRFGEYRGTIREPGLWFSSPFVRRKRVSLRIRDFETSWMRVTEQYGNAIDVAATVVWRVVDTAAAVFQVESYERYVQIQSEAALRDLATQHPYEPHEAGEMSLRTHSTTMAHMLKDDLQARLAEIGIEVIEARISHLAYAPEVASLMQRQRRVRALVAIRHSDIAGAAGTVETALQILSHRGGVELDGEQKAAMASHMLLTLCRERDVRPELPAGARDS